MMLDAEPDDIDVATAHRRSRDPLPAGQSAQADQRWKAQCIASWLDVCCSNGAEHA